MAIAALPDERAARSPHPPAWAERLTGRHHPGSVHAHPGRATPSVTADDRQAEYFVELLLQSRREVDRRIEEYHRSIAVAEVRHEPGQVQRLLRLLGIDEHERQVVDEMIANLQRRFPDGHYAGVPMISRRTRPVVR
jgi:hypothetical protein